MGRHPEIDEAAYNRGRKQFSKGASIKSLFQESAKAEQTATDHVQREAADTAAFSTVIGFLDAFIDAVRKR